MPNRLLQIPKFILRQKKWLSPVLVLLTALIFWRFFSTHPQYLETIKNIKFGVVLGIILFNVGLLVCVVMINQTLLQMLGSRMKTTDQFLLTAYSSLANFFGPLQSGPGVRAVYLKTKLSIRIKDFVLASLLQYAIFALISIGLLLGASDWWWLSVFGLLGVGTGCFIFIKFYGNKNPESYAKVRQRLTPQNIGRLITLTVAQMVFIVGYYFIELRAVNAAISLKQAISYTGAANFGLFVSLTPDAIGVRELFLGLTRHLHHVNGAEIISANLIDRAVYALFLLLLFAIVLAFHGQRKLKLKAAKT